MAREALTLEFETEAFRAWTEAHIRHLTGPEKKKALKALAFAFLSRVIQKTPVDTGRARGGWMSYLLSNQGVSGVGGAEAAALATLSAGDTQAVREGVKQGSFTERFTSTEAFVAIVNGVNYIVLLEFGSSDQAPAGMMRITFREMRVAGSGSEVLQDAFVSAVRQANRTARVRRARSLPG